MAEGLQWRMLRERIARGEATGVLCREEQVAAWKERLLAIHFARMAGEKTVYFVTGATVILCTTPEEALGSDRAKRPTTWIDEENLLDAQLPAPKPRRDE